MTWASEGTKAPINGIFDEDLNPPIRAKLTGIQIWIHCIRIRIQLFKQTLLTLFGIQIRIYSLGIQILVFS